MNSKEYKFKDGRTVVFEYDENGIGQITLECMDAIMDRIAKQWIPCSERLPEALQTVLITHRGGVSTGWHNGRYWTRGASTNQREIRTVVAWLPLPEPYKEEK